MADFKLFLLRKGLKPSTVHGEITSLNRVLRDADIQDVDNYLLKLLEGGAKPSYLNNIVKAVRNYGQFISDPKLASIPFFKQNVSVKGIMSMGEIADFLVLPPTVGGEYAWHYKKMTLFWTCLAHSGARTGEVANLTIEQVDLGQMVFLVEGKTGPRNVPINPVLVPPLEAHIKLLKGQYLFPSMRTDRPIERSSWNFDFHHRLTRLGIKRPHLTPYSLRHSFITRMLDEDINLFKVQKIVGHKRLETTAHYTHLTTKDIIKTIAKDPLSRGAQSFDERFKYLREGVRKLLEDTCLTAQEEKQMLGLLVD